MSTRRSWTSERARRLRLSCPPGLGGDRLRRHRARAERIPRGSGDGGPGRGPRYRARPGASCLGVRAKVRQIARPGLMDSSEPDPDHDCNTMPDATDHSPCASQAPAGEIFVNFQNGERWPHAARFAVMQGLLQLAVTTAEPLSMPIPAGRTTTNQRLEAWMHWPAFSAPKQIQKDLHCGPVRCTGAVVSGPGMHRVLLHYWARH